LPYLSPK
jgi:hypothetical protein